MNKIIIALLMIFSIILAGCSSNLDDTNSDEIRENLENLVEENEMETSLTEEQLNEIEEQVSEIFENLENVEQEILEDQIIFEDENSNVKVEDGRIIAQVERTVDFESAPFDKWCIVGETYAVEADEGGIESVIQGVSTHRGIEVCEAHHTMIQETPIGTFEINTVYFINEEITKIWVLTDFMGQVTETEIELQ